MDFAILADQKVKLKESDKKNKCLDLVKELKKKLCNVNVTVIPILIGVLSTITEGLV